VFDDFGGASVEYLRKEERKDCLGMRAEMRGTRRAEVRKERVMGFMMMVVVVAGKRGRDGEIGDSNSNGGIMYWELSDLPVGQFA
jgi:hypothetical protein